MDFISSNLRQFIMEIRKQFTLKNLLSSSLLSTHRRRISMKKKPYSHQNSAKIRKKCAWPCCLTFFIDLIVSHSKQLALCSRPYSVLLTYLMIIHLLVTPCICIVSNYEPFMQWMMLRRKGEETLQKYNRFITGLDGLELKNWIQFRRSQIEVDLNVAENIERFWVSITPCTRNISTWYTDLKKARENQRPRNDGNIYEIKGNFFMNRAKPPEGRSDLWTSKMYNLNCSDTIGCNYEVDDMNYAKRLDLEVTNLGKNLLRLFVKGRFGDGFMLRMSARLSPYSDFYGYPRLPASSKVDVCWKKEKLLRISWSPSTSSSMNITYCVAINHDMPLYNRCSAKTRLALDMVGSIWTYPDVRYFESTDDVRGGRIANAIYECTNQTKIDIKLSTRFSDSSSLFVNLYAINDIDLSQSYLPVQFDKMNDIKMCYLDMGIQKVFPGEVVPIQKINDWYIRRKFVSQYSIRPRTVFPTQGNYNGNAKYIYFQRCKYFKKDKEIFSANFRILDGKHNADSKFGRKKYELITDHFNGSLSLEIYYNSSLGGDIRGEVARLIPQKSDARNLFPKFFHKNKIELKCRNSKRCDNTICPQLRKTAHSVKQKYYLRVVQITRKRDDANYGQLKREIKEKVNRCGYEEIWSDYKGDMKYSEYWSEKRIFQVYYAEEELLDPIKVSRRHFNLILIYKYSLKDNYHKYGALARMTFLAPC